MSSAKDFHAEYRVYARDASGHIMSVSSVTCASDREGLTKARAVKNAHVRELWQGARMIARLDADGNEMSLDAS